VTTDYMGPPARGQPGGLGRTRKGGIVVEWVRFGDMWNASAGIWVPLMSMARSYARIICALFSQPKETPCLGSRSP